MWVTTHTLNPNFRAQGLGLGKFPVRDLGFRGLGFVVQRQGSGFRIKGSGCGLLPTR